MTLHSPDIPKYALPIARQKQVAMSNSKHSVQPLTQADLPSLANSLIAAKLQLAINRFLFKDWPNEPAQRAIYTDSAKRNIDDPDNTCLKAVDDVSGEMVGYIIITHVNPRIETPATDNTNASQGQQPNIPDAFDPEVLPTVIKMIESVHTETENIEHIRWSPLQI